MANATGQSTVGSSDDRPKDDGQSADRPITAHLIKPVKQATTTLLNLPHSATNPRRNNPPSMVENAPIRSIQHADLTIEGYSRAAVQTYWRVPELGVGFDFGAQPWSFMGTDTWFVSHAHLDHIVALPVYVARRRMMKMEPPTIYLPESNVAPVRQLLQQFTRLDRGRMPCDLRPIAPGDEVELPGNWS